MKKFFLHSLFLLMSTFVVAQTLGPVGPGSDSTSSFTDNQIQQIQQIHQVQGHFSNWDRPFTPSLVLRTAGPGPRMFADIHEAGTFQIALPTMSEVAAYGSKNCGDPSKEPILVLSDIDLLTTLDGFGSKSEANGGLSVIGMAALADEDFSQDIAKLGTKRAQWIASSVARTVAVGECNNSNSFELLAGWNAVTIIYGADGGPHRYKQGLAEDMAWYWWAFKEPSSETADVSEIDLSLYSIDMPETIDADSSMLLGRWNALQSDANMTVDFSADGKARLQSREGNRIQDLQGTWEIKNNQLSMMLDGMSTMAIQQYANDSFRLISEDLGIDIVFLRAGIAHRPVLLMGRFAAQSGQGMVLDLKADGVATIEFGFEDREVVEGNWYFQDYKLIIEDDSESIIYDLLSLADLGFNLSGEHLGEEIVLFLRY